MYVLEHSYVLFYVPPMKLYGFIWVQNSKNNELKRGFKYSKTAYI